MKTRSMNVTLVADPGDVETQLRKHMALADGAKIEITRQVKLMNGRTKFELKVSEPG